MLQCFCKDFHIISSSFNDSIAYLMLLCIENILKVQYRQIFKVYDENWLLNTRNRFFHSAKIKDLNIFQSFVKFNVVYPNPDFAPLTFWIDWLIDWLVFNTNINLQYSAILWCEQILQINFLWKNLISYTLVP